MFRGPTRSCVPSVFSGALGVCQRWWPSMAGHRVPAPAHHASPPVVRTTPPPPPGPQQRQTYGDWADLLVAFVDPRQDGVRRLWRGMGMGGVLRLVRMSIV